MISLIPLPPDPIAFHVGPMPVHWYGICYAVGLGAAYAIMSWEARRRGLATRVIDNGMVIVLPAGLIGARLYHVIDEWDVYSRDPLAIFTPPYAGLGVYGAIIASTIAVFVIMRLWHQSFWRWADVIAPGAFIMQACARWGNYFNQELFGPPTTLPWGIAIECRHRAEQWPCARFPQDSTGFHPLFLYESLSGLVGTVVLLWVARRWGGRLRPGDLFLAWALWYAAVRLGLETLRVNNWTMGGIPTATVVSSAIVVGALGTLAWRHRAAVGSD